MRVIRQLPFTVLPVLFAMLVFVVAPAMAQFGVERYGIGAQNQDGTPDVQAGSHPYSFTNTFLLTRGQGDLKDTQVELPAGFVGDPDATPKCTYQDFVKQEKREASCSNSTAVGVATLYLYNAVEPEQASPTTVAVYNLVPPTGVAAEFGFLAENKVPVLLQVSVRTGGDYGLTVTVSNVGQTVLIAATKVTIWGVPANPAHNPIRGGCEGQQNGDPAPIEAVGRGLREGEDEVETPIHRESEPGYNPEIDGGLPESGGECPDAEPEIPLLTNPTSCGVPRTSTLGVDSWEEPGDFATGEHVASMSASLPELSGCEKLDFSPTISVTPDGSGVVPRRG